MIDGSALILIAAALPAAVLGYVWAAWSGRRSLERLLLEKQRLETEAEGLTTRKIELENQLLTERETLEKAQQECRQLAERASSSEQRADAYQREERKTQVLLSERNDEVQRHLKSISEQAERVASLGNELAQFKASHEERERSYAREAEKLAAQEQRFRDSFSALSSTVLEASSRKLEAENRKSLSGIIDPFKESIGKFQQEVRDIHSRDQAQRSALKTELENLQKLNQQITQEAHELSTALRGQKKLQGNWGELVLENVLDRSGLVAGKDYRREVSFTTDDGRQRPDAIVYLPQSKHLIIDAKVSLNAYTRYVNAENEHEGAVALSEHVQAMRDRITELSERDYPEISELNSPDMVFMFVPIESAFVEALKADETLFQEAIEKHVLVATPTTLLTSLNIVRQLWRYEDQNKHTAALAQRAEGVFRKLNTFLASFEAIKSSLDKAKEAYDRAEGQLVSGRGNLVKQVSEFKRLAPSIKGELPPRFLEKAELEVDYIRPEATVERDENPSSSD